MGNTMAPVRPGLRTQDRRVRELALDALSVMAFSVTVSVSLVCGLVVVSHLVT